MDAMVTIDNIKGFTDWLESAVLQQQGADQAGKLGQRLNVRTSTINKWRQGRTQRLSIAYVQNIAKYLGGKWSIEDVKAWLKSPNGTSIATFNEHHNFESKKKTSDNQIGGRVQEILSLIRSLHTTNGVSSEEQLAIITEVVSPSMAIVEQPAIPPEWVEVINLFPKDKLSELYESGRGIPGWEDSVNETLTLKRIPDRMTVCVMCLLVNRHNPGKLRYQPEQIEQILDPLRDSIRLGSKEPSKMDNK